MINSSLCVLLYNISYEDFHHFFLEITELIKYIGPEKVYLTIFNNNSTRNNLNILNEWLIVNNVDNILIELNYLINLIISIGKNFLLIGESCNGIFI